MPASSNLWAVRIVQLHPERRHVTVRDVNLIHLQPRRSQLNGNADMAYLYGEINVYY